MEKQKQSVAPPEPARRKTLVCVTDQFSCERIIQAGRTIADITHTELVVLSVADSAHPQNPKALQFLYDVSRKNGANMTVLYSDNFTKTLISYIKSEWVVNLLTGMPGSEDSPLYRVWDRFKNIRSFAVTPEGSIRPVENNQIA